MAEEKQARNSWVKGKGSLFNWLTIGSRLKTEENWKMDDNLREQDR